MAMESLRLEDARHAGQDGVRRDGEQPGDILLGERYPELFESYTLLG